MVGGRNRQKYWVIGIGAVVVLGLIAILLEPTDEVVATAEASGHEERESGQVEAPPSSAAPRASDPRLMVPAELPGFALMAEGPLMRNATRTEDGAPLRAVQVLYRATDRSGLTAKLLAQISPDEVPRGRKYEQLKVGGHAAALGRDTDTGNTWVMWRNGEWHYYLLVSGKGRKAKRIARKVAPKLANAVAEHADAAVAGLEGAERTKRVASTRRRSARRSRLPRSSNSGSRRSQAVCPGGRCRRSSGLDGTRSRSRFARFGSRFGRRFGRTKPARSGKSGP